MYILLIFILNLVIVLFEFIFINIFKLIFFFLVLFNKESNCLFKFKLVLEFVLESLFLFVFNIFIRIGGIFFLFFICFKFFIIIVIICLYIKIFLFFDW